MLDQMKIYPSLDPADVRLVRHAREQECERSLLVFQTPFGTRRVAELFEPRAQGPFPAVLYLHWYEPEAGDSNRSQFAAEAAHMAARGAVCMTVETLWSDPDFFVKRTQADDIAYSQQEVAILRRYMDYLLSRKGVQPERFALVGHDFGAMYGVLGGSLDGRPSHYVLMAATPRFTDWYLYAPKLEGDARGAFIREFTPLDPISRIPQLAPAPVFFQFALDDPHVPRDRALEFFAAAKEPKQMSWYTSGHGLNAQAAHEREAWLQEQLGF